MQNKGEAYYMYIKNAKVDLLCRSNTKFTIGLQGMNMFSVQEKTWGHRFIEKSAIDKYKFSVCDLIKDLSKSYQTLVRKKTGA